MDSITITFAEGTVFNVSLQLGDIAFYQSTSGVVRMIGEITAINQGTYSITCDIDPVRIRPGADDFVFFVKDEEVNKSGLVGNHALVTMKITPSEDEEPSLFSVSAEVVKSS